MDGIFRNGIPILPLIAVELIFVMKFCDLVRVFYSQSGHRPSMVNMRFVTASTASLSSCLSVS